MHNVQRGGRERAGFTIVELLVVVALITILMTLLLPALGRAREQARIVNWAAHSSGLTKDMDMLLYYNFEHQSPSDQRLLNRAAMDPMFTARFGIDPEKFFGRLGDSADSTAKDPAWTDGRWRGKGALNFVAAEDDYLFVAPMHFIGDKPISVFGWVRRRSFSNWGRIIDFGNGAAKDNILVANKGTSMDLRFEVWNTPPAPTPAKVNTHDVAQFWAESDQKWMHFACVLDENLQYSTYVNGMPVGAPVTRTTLPRKTMRSWCYISRSNWGADDEFDGYIDELGFMQRALTAEQIATMYEVGIVSK